MGAYCAYPLFALIYAYMSDYQIRLAAAQRGERTYDGKPCKHGHGTLRYTSNGVCTACTAVRSTERQEKIRQALREAD